VVTVVTVVTVVGFGCGGPVDGVAHAGDRADGFASVANTVVAP
jgi:hypothetical protein